MFNSDLIFDKVFSIIDVNWRIGEPIVDEYPLFVYTPNSVLVNDAHEYLADFGVLSNEQMVDNFWRLYTSVVNQYYLKNEYKKVTNGNPLLKHWRRFVMAHDYLQTTLLNLTSEWDIISKSSYGDIAVCLEQQNTLVPLHNVICNLEVVNVPVEDFIAGSFVDAFYFDSLRAHLNPRIFNAIKQPFIMVCKPWMYQNLEFIRNDFDGFSIIHNIEAKNV